MKRKMVCLMLSSLMAAALVLASCAPAAPAEEEIQVPQSRSYEDLIQLFEEWREFQKPEVRDGIYDYTAAAMEKQRVGLKDMQDRLAAIDPSSWPVSQQVDYHIVRAEMNGLDFDFRVLRPWSRNPCFYAAYYSLYMLEFISEVAAGTSRIHKKDHALRSYLF